MRVTFSLSCVCVCVGDHQTCGNGESKSVQCTHVHHQSLLQQIGKFFHSVSRIYTHMEGLINPMKALFILLHYMCNIFRKLTWLTHPRRSKLSCCRRYDTPSALTPGLVTVPLPFVQVLAASDADADEEGAAPMISKPQVHPPPCSHVISPPSSSILPHPSHGFLSFRSRLASFLLSNLPSFVTY